MVDGAHLEARPEALTPVTGGWFVVNVRDGAWVRRVMSPRTREGPVLRPFPRRPYLEAS